MRTPDYVITQEYRLPLGIFDEKLLPAGAFVKPIQLQYVPKHVLENPTWRGFNKKTDVFCYCRLGFVVLPKNMIRRV